MPRMNRLIPVMPFLRFMNRSSMKLKSPAASPGECVR
jgi:hypothetical protein